MPKRPQTTQRRLTTVLFTDIVGSTQRASELGDRRWRQLLTRHHAGVRRLLRRHGGREIDTAGDGFFATFDQPAQAIECAVAVGRAMRSLGIEVRAGIHMGEVEISGDRVTGIAVHIGSRVMSAAGPSEVLVSNTVRDLLSGSDFRFEDRGVRELKGVPGEWRLSAVTDVPGLEEEDEAEPVEAAAARRRGRFTVPVALAIVLGVVAVLVIPELVSGGGGKASSLVTPAANTVVRIDPSGDKVLGGIQVGNTPIGIAADIGKVWVANFDAGTVQSIDPTNNEASSAIALGFDQAPAGVAVGGGFVWVVSSTTGFLYQLDPSQSHHITPIELGVGVTGVAYGGEAVWVTNGISDSVLRIDQANPKAPPQTIALDPGTKPSGIAFGDGSVWVAESLKGAVAQIDPNQMRVVATIPLLGGNLDRVAFGEGFVWVTETQANAVVRIDPKVNRPTTITGVGTGPTGIAAGNGFAWVANSLDGSVAKIDPGTAKVIARCQLGAGLSPDGVALTPGAVWIAVHAP